MSNVFIAFQANEESRPVVEAILADNPNAVAVESPGMVKIDAPGHLTIRRQTIEDLTGEDWMNVLGVNLLGAVYFTKHAFRTMKPGGFTKHAFRTMKPGGAIVNISSIHAVQTDALLAPYAAAKAAMLSLTRTAAIEDKPKGIRSNAILPGAIDTRMLWDNPNVKSGVEKIEESEIGQPEDIAAAVAFLGSEDAKFITGTTLNVDGGRLVKL